MYHLPTTKSRKRVF